MNYKLPVTWQVIDDVEVEANSLKEAIGKLSKINSEKELPKGQYVNHSFEVQTDFIHEDYKDD